MARLVEVFQSTGSVWSPTAGSEREREALRFQSTGSVWSPTTAFSIMKKHGDISIHGLRVEPDRQKKLLTSQKIHFNPRAPCGARRQTEWQALAVTEFQSTGSVWSPTSTKASLIW